MKRIWSSIFVVFLVASCSSPKNQQLISATYADSSTGEYVRFEPSGVFYYSLDIQGTGKKAVSYGKTEADGVMGHYTIDERGNIYPQVVSNHAGTFTLSFGDTKDELKVWYEVTGMTKKFQKESP